MNPTAISLLRRGIARSRDLQSHGITRTNLSRLTATGEIVRIGRGVYALSERAPSERESLIAVARRSDRSFFCLLTALRFHRLTTQAPFEVWIGIGNKDRAPRMDWPQLRIARYSGEGMISGIEAHVEEGAKFRVTGVARTLVDCFKFRNKIGLDVAIEALQQAHRERRVNIDEISRQSARFRLANVMRPYLESLS